VSPRGGVLDPQMSPGHEADRLAPYPWCVLHGDGEEMYADDPDRDSEDDEGSALLGLSC
jgi:hypothetical protein